MATTAIEEEVLDSFKIAQLLGSFLRSPPHKSPQVLLLWQVEQLVPMAEAVFTGQPGLLDAIGALYCISFYCATAPKFEDDRQLVACTMVLQTVAMECLYAMQLGIRDGIAKDSIHFVHPSQAFLKDNIRTLPPSNLYDILFDAYDLARDIVRDIKDQIRTSHEPSLQKKDDYKDGLYAHSIYFMCCFGLAHVAAILATNNHLNAIPGISEILLLTSLVTCYEAPAAVLADLAPPTSVHANLAKPQKSAVKAAKSQKEGGKSIFVEESRLQKCIITASKLSTALVLFSFDERLLQEIRLVRTRMKRRFTHPDVSYAQDMSVNFINFLKGGDVGDSNNDAAGNAGSSPSKAGELQPPLNRQPAVATSAADQHVFEPTRLFGAGPVLSIGGRTFNGSIFIRPETLDPKPLEAPEPMPLSVDEWTGLDLKIPSVDVDGDDDDDAPVETNRLQPREQNSYSALTTTGSAASMSPPVSSKGARRTASFRSAAAHAVPRSPSSAVGRVPHAHPPASARSKMDETWRIKKHLLEAYTVTEPLRHRHCVRPYLATTYRPKFFPIRIRGITPKTGLSRQELVRCGDQVESAYYNVDQFSVPRHLNPSCGAFWLIEHLVEFLYTKTIRNEGFKRSMEIVAAELKVEVRMMKQLRLQKAENVAISSAPVDVVRATSTSPPTQTKSCGAQQADSSVGNTTSAADRGSKVHFPPIISAAKGASLASSATSSRAKGGQRAPAALTLADKLQMASVEARAEVKLLELERKLQQADDEQQHEKLIHLVDRTLMDGLTTLKKIKTQQARTICAASIVPSTTASAADNTRPKVGDSSGSSRVGSSQNHRNKLNDPLVRFLADPNVREIETFRTAMRKTGIIDQTEADEPHPPPGAATDLPVAGAPNAAVAALQGFGGPQSDAEPKPPSDVSMIWRKSEAGGKKRSVKQEEPEEQQVTNEEAKEYIKNIIDYQRGQRDLEEEQRHFLQYRMDKDTKAFEERSQKREAERREKAKTEAKANQAILTKILEYKRQHLIEQRRTQKKERELKKEEARVFREHVCDLKVADIEKAEETQWKHLQELDDEKEKIEDVWVRLEMKENLRRLEEEGRMRFLEEKRRESDRRKAMARAEKTDRLRKLREKAADDIERSVSRVRLGNFAYIMGKIGFYNDIRKQPVPWVAFVHPDGKPIYFDPLTNKAQRNMPTDAPVVDAEPDDIRWRNVVYGPGSYEKWIADWVFKDAYNADGGYFDDEGNWVVATGYYEWRDNGEYEFVQYEGYYDQKGRYILHPKPHGDLGFMV